MRITLGKQLFWGTGAFIIGTQVNRYMKQDIIQDLNEARRLSKELDADPKLAATRAQAKDPYSLPPQ